MGFPSPQDEYARSLVVDAVNRAIIADDLIDNFDKVRAIFLFVQYAIGRTNSGRRGTKYLGPNAIPPCQSLRAAKNRSLRPTVIATNTAK